MKTVIISTAIKFTNKADVETYTKLSPAALPLDDYELEGVAKYAVGYEHIVLLGASGKTMLRVKRDKVRGLAVDGQPIVIHGDDFKRIDFDDPDLNALKAEIEAAGSGGLTKSELRQYLEINRSGLPVAAIDANTDEVTVFPNITELFMKWPSVEITMEPTKADGNEKLFPGETHWEIGVH